MGAFRERVNAELSRVKWNSVSLLGTKKSYYSRVLRAWARRCCGKHVADSVAEVWKLVRGKVAAEKCGVGGTRKSGLAVISSREKNEGMGRSIPVNMGSQNSTAKLSRDRVLKGSPLTGRENRHLTIRGGVYGVGVVVRVLGR